MNIENGMLQINSLNFEFDHAKKNNIYCIA